jgi:serpin B
VFAVNSAYANDTNSKLLAESNLAFGIDMYQQLKKPNSNLFFSPFSIYEALAMVNDGAGGETASQIKAVLRPVSGLDIRQGVKNVNILIKNMQKDGQGEIAVANSIWPDRDYHFLEGYLVLLKDIYGVQIEPVDYKKEATREKAQKKINQWVEEKTKDKIKNLISKNMLSEDTRMVLVNAIYFKGNWETVFDKDATRKLPFHKGDGSDETTDFMNRRGVFGYKEVENAQLLEIPYKGGKTSMVIVLPNSSSEIKQIEDKLSVAQLNDWMSKMQYKKVDAVIPKFKMNYSSLLNGPLESLGMKLAFDKNRADFSGMDGCNAQKCDHWLYVSKGIHQAFISVDEEGTEAGAATAFHMAELTSVGAPVPVFKAYHPFLFFIRESDNGIVLFMGRFAAPQ